MRQTELVPQRLTKRPALLQQYTRTLEVSLSDCHFALEVEHAGDEPRVAGRS
jgi:hypothetical protein